MRQARDAVVRATGQDVDVRVEAVAPVRDGVGVGRGRRGVPGQHRPDAVQARLVAQPSVGGEVDGQHRGVGQAAVPGIVM